MKYFRLPFDPMWASTADPVNVGDPDVYQPTDPSYPEAVPEQYAAGWFVSPSLVVKQPHEWLNFWLNGTEDILITHGSTMNLWHELVNYAERAVVVHDGIYYVALQANIGYQPDTNPLMWDPAQYAGKTYDDAKAEIDAAIAQLNAHTGDKTNPHEVNTTQIDGYTKQEIDALIATESGDADAHIARTDNPHQVDYNDIDSVSAALGGSFTGQVSLLKAILNGGATAEYTGNTAKILFNSKFFGLEKAKRAAAKDGKPLVSDLNYEDIKKRNNYKFSVPVPDVHLPLTSDINARLNTRSGNSKEPDIEYLSTGTLEYTNKSGEVVTAAINEPAFSVDGLLIAPGSVLNVTGMQLNDPTGMITAIVDGVFQEVGPGALNQLNVLEYFDPVVSIKDIRIWCEPLTDQQLSAIGG